MGFGLAALILLGGVVSTVIQIRNGRRRLVLPLAASCIGAIMAGIVASQCLSVSLAKIRVVQVERRPGSAQERASIFDEAQDRKFDVAVTAGGMNELLSSARAKIVEEWVDGPTLTRVVGLDRRRARQFLAGAIETQP